MPATVFVLPLQLLAWRVAGAEGPLHYVMPREPVTDGELRVTVAGSGMPYTTRAQAAASFLVQLGNAEQTLLIFDLGSSSMANINAAGADMSKLTRVFVTHYHVDHTGDLPALYGAGMVMGRQTPLHVHGPSGAVPDHGLEYLCDGLRRFTRWDMDSRLGKVDHGSAQELICHEFDYSKKNQVVYSDSELGVTVTATPVVHIIDGPVAYRLDWKGRSFVFSGDTKPCQNMVELAKGADIFVHEAFVLPETLAHAMQIDLEDAHNIVEHVHTPLRGAGVVFAAARPALAVAYHLWLQERDVPRMVDELRRTYAGPLAIAEDLMVYEATAGGVRQRRLLGDARALPLPARRGTRRTTEGPCGAEGQEACPAEPPRHGPQTGLSQFLRDTVIEV